MADRLEIAEKGGDMRVLLLVSFAVIVAPFGLRGRTMRYASLRNSSAVSRDGGRDVDCGMVLDEFLSVSRVFMVGVRSVMVVNVWSMEVGGDVDVLLSTSERPSCAVGLPRLPNFWCPTIFRLRKNSINMLRCRHMFFSHNIYK